MRTRFCGGWKFISRAGNVITKVEIEGNKIHRLKKPL